jgi:Holliday junction resolvase
MRRAARTDATHGPIVEALRKAGCSVLSLAALGHGVPDLLVYVGSGFHGEYLLLEVKDGAKPPSRTRLTPDQIEFHAEWRGPIYTVCSVEEAMIAVGLRRG